MNFTRMQHDQPITVTKPPVLDSRQRSSAYSQPTQNSDRITLSQSKALSRLKQQQQLQLHGNTKGSDDAGGYYNRYAGTRAGSVSTRKVLNYARGEDAYVDSL